MKYFVKQKVFSIGDKFTIKNESDQDCFQVMGKVFSLGNKLTLMDMNGNELYFIEQKLMKFMPEYHLQKAGQVMAIVKKKLTFLKARFEITSSLGNFTVEGSPFGYEFSITKSGLQVATISKKIFSLSDTYCIDVTNVEDEAFIVALVIIIDQVIHENKQG